MRGMYGNVIRISLMNIARTDVDPFLELLDHSRSACRATASGKARQKPRVTGSNIAGTLTSNGTVVPAREPLVADVLIEGDEIREVRPALRSMPPPQ